MRTRLITVALLSAMLVGAMWGAVARAQVLDTNLEITEFVMKPVDTPHSYPPTQAGGNPDVSLFFRFCGPGLAVDNVVVDPQPTLGKFIVTTKSAHQVVNPFTFVKMRGVRTPGGVNGVWTAQPISGTGGALDPVRFRLVNQTRPPDSDDAFAPVTADAPNGHAQIAASNNFYGCTGQQSKGKIADFKLRLPPGFLGNPGATLACPTHLFIASSCSDRSILGWSVTETVIDGASNFTPPTRIETPVFNVATLGLEPARLGTRQFPSEPAGPFPIKIDLRTTGDYGIDSALIDIPKNLGGPQALITQIETILCAQVPCKAADPQDPGTVTPLPPTRPFFRNPTSCKPATATLEARSWAPNAVVDTATSTFTPTGCNDVPFDLDVKVAPTTQPAGTPVQNDVTLEYPQFADADIWQGAVKDVDLTLPEGLALNAGGGYGLQACSFEQYGVDPTTLKQTTRGPAKCPEGSQIGTVSVTSPALEGALSGKAFFGPVTGPGRPTEASPWNLFLLIEGAGLRVKLAGKVVVSESGQVRNFFTTQPEVPFTQLNVSLRGGERAILTSTNTCGTSSGEAKLTAYANKSIVRTPTVENTGCPATRPFNPVVEVAEGIPKTAGANSVSRIVFSRPDGDANLTGLNLSLPAGATGSLAAAPQCPLAQAQAGTCPESTRIGTIRNTVGNGNSLLTVPGELYLSEAIQPGDAASIAVRVPAKVGPIDLGQVVLMNRIFLRESDNGLEVQMVSKIPTMLEGVPLPIRRVEILVDRAGLLPEPDRLRATHPDGDLLRRGRRAVVLEHRARRDAVRRPAVRPRHPADRRRARQNRPVRPPAVPGAGHAGGRRGGHHQRARRAAADPAAERALLQRAGGPLQRRAGRDGHLPAEVEGRHRARVLAAAAVSDRRTGAHRPGDRERAAQGVRIPARADRPRGAAEGPQQLPAGTADHQHVRKRARPAAVLLRAEPERRPAAASSTTSRTSARRLTPTGASTRPSPRTAASRPRRDRGSRSGAARSRTCVLLPCRASR